MPFSACAAAAGFRRAWVQVPTGLEEREHSVLRFGSFGVSTLGQRVARTRSRPGPTIVVPVLDARHVPSAGSAGETSRGGELP